MMIRTNNNTLICCYRFYASIRKIFPKVEVFKLLIGRRDWDISTTGDFLKTDSCLSDIVDHVLSSRMD